LLVIKASEVLPISITAADNEYDSEYNYVFVIEYAYDLSIICLLDTKTFHYREHIADIGRSSRGKQDILEHYYTIRRRRF
jgi:hypothetical protein